jgi:hypothetical protein
MSGMITPPQVRLGQTKRAIVDRQRTNPGLYIRNGSDGSGKAYALQAQAQPQGYAAYPNAIYAFPLTARFTLSLRVAQNVARVKL